MTGVVGIVAHRRDEPVSAQEVDDLATAYEGLRGGGRQVMQAGDFALFTIITGTHERALASHDPVGEGARSWASVCGPAYIRRGFNVSDIAEIDGQFVWLSYDAEIDRFQVATDPFGMQALYVAQKADKTYVSTSALALAKHLRAAPNRLGLLIFLRAGYQFGKVTNWEGIERLDPGTRISFTPQGPTRDVYWRPSIDESVTQLGLGDAADHCSNVVLNTYRTSFAGRSRGWADLTGGYDSRLLTLLLQGAGVDFATNTVGAADTPDVQIAARVANAAGWDWSRFDIPTNWPDLLLELIPRSVGWGDCHLDAVQLAEVLSAHIAKAQLYPTLFNGGGGEHFQSYAWQQEFLNVGRSNRVNLDNWVDMMMMKPIGTDVFATDPTPEVRDDLRARMASYAEPYSSHLNTVQLDMLYAYKCTGHFGAYLSAGSGALSMELPFYLKPVFSAAFSTSHHHRVGHRLMRRMIDTLNPGVAALVTTKGGPAAPLRAGNAHLFLPYYRSIGRKAITKVSERVLHRSLLLPEGPADPVRATARESLLRSIGDGRPLRAHALRSAELFKATALEALLARAGQPGLRDATLLQRIITVELALRAADASL
jgi:hypothetical protein